MARLTQTDKEVLQALSDRGWVQSAEERSPLFVEPTVENIESYCRWVSELSRWISRKRPVRFSGDNWKL